jgi:hypothetical protein
MNFPSKLRLALTILWLPSTLLAQSRKVEEKITKEFILSGDAGRHTLAVYNIMGSVTVQGYAGKTVQVEITKTVTSKTDAGLELGKKEVQPGFRQSGDSVTLSVVGPGPQDSRPRGHRQSWSINYNDEDEGPRYRFSFDYVVKVPYQMNARVSTVNGGTVDIRDVSGSLSARNVNGGIVIKNAQRVTSAHTVNGNVDVACAGKDVAKASFKTVNGQITVAYPPGTSANLRFKSLHGQLYTDFPQTEMMPGQVIQNKESEGGGTKYKLSKGTAVRLGKGGPDLTFETINGNATIKQLTK